MNDTGFSVVIERMKENNMIIKVDGDGGVYWIGYSAEWEAFYVTRKPYTKHANARTLYQSPFFHEAWHWFLVKSKGGDI